MNLASVSLTLAVSTAWFTIFLGAVRAPALRFYPWQILKITAAWLLVALSAPALIFHWYLIFAFVVLIAWFHVRRERFLAAKVWISIAAGLGISIGVIFYLQAAPALFPSNLPPREALLLLASLYLGGGVTGLAYATRATSRDSDGLASTPRHARLLLVLAMGWIAIVGLELEFPNPALHPVAHTALERLLLASIAVVAVLSILTVPAARSGESRRALTAIAVLAFATQLLARWLNL